MIGKSILVVEDEPLVGMELQDGLHRLGYTVPEVVTNGDEVQNAMNRVHPDLVLMDIRINGSLDGIQATARLRETSDVPVIFLTAYSDSATIQRAAESLPDGYLLKPFEERELAANIEMHLLKAHSRMKEEKSLQKMFPLLDALDTGLILFNRRGQWAHGNPEALRVFGLAALDSTQSLALPGLLCITEEEFAADPRRWTGREYPLPAVKRGADRTLALEAFKGTDGQEIGFLAVLHPMRKEERAHMNLSANTVNETLSKLLPVDGQYSDRLECSGFLLPNASGTGDIYDLFPLGPHHFVFYSLDVAGHGPLPAMIAYSLHSAIRDLARSFFKRNAEVPSPCSLLEALNRKFLAKADAPFFTLTLGILTPATGEFQLARAGHTRTLWAKSDGSFEWLHGKGTALGAFPGIVFEELSGRLRANDRLILCSDGVLEAFGDKNLDQGYAILEDLIRLHAGGDIASMTLAIKTACLSAKKGSGDDMSLLAIGSRLW